MILDYQAVEKVQFASADYFFVRCMGHKSPMLPQKKQSFLRLTLFEPPEKNEDFDFLKNTLFETIFSTGCYVVVKNSLIH